MTEYTRATEAVLAALHGEFAETLRARLKLAKEDAGEGKGIAAELNVIRQFLKDNGIEAVAESGGEDQFSKLIKETTGGTNVLPFETPERQASG